MPNFDDLTRMAKQVREHNAKNHQVTAKTLQENFDKAVDVFCEATGRERHKVVKSISTLLNSKGN